MVSENEIKKAQKLFLLIHNHRYSFLYQAESNPDKWLTVLKSEGTSWKDYILRDDQILDILSGANAVIKIGFKNIRNVEYLSCRFGKYTKYFVLDIDSKNNEYYCLNIIHKIVEITKHIGSPIFMQSSYTRGWHLRWYLTEEVKTYDLALYLRNLFLKNGFIIQGGKFEIFPNVKSDPKTMYQGIRLPCQKGSAILSFEDGRVIANWNEGAEIFLCHWADEVNKNLIDSNIIIPLLNGDYKNPKTKKWEQEYMELKENGLRGGSQTNKLLGIIAKGLIVFEGINDVEVLTKSLCQWIDLKHNGYSEEYNENPNIAYAHCKRWAICALKKYKPLSKLVNKPVINNSKKAISAQINHQLQKAFKDGSVTSEMSIRKIAEITGIPKSVIQRKLKE